MDPKIYATGNIRLQGDFNISYYILEKDHSFLDWLYKLLNEVLDIKNNPKVIIKEPEQKDNDEWSDQEVYIKEISKMIDIHEKYENKKGDRVDLFYGKDRVYLTLRKSEEMREKFAAFVKKTKDWIVIEKIKDIPNYVSKKIEVSSQK